MISCFVCSIPMPEFQALALTDEIMTYLARQLIDGMIHSARMTPPEAFKTLAKARGRRGTCIVERCARFAEQACSVCKRPDCPRCALAAELRANEERINGERDAELETLGPDLEDIEKLVDAIPSSLCNRHGALGPVILREWYMKRAYSGGELPTPSTQLPLAAVGG